jgi:hypothetical protein
MLAVHDNTHRLAQVFLRIKRLYVGLSSSQRTVSLGSSASTVALLVKIAWLWARKRCTSRRACGGVIHWLSPLAIAVRPSRDAPSLSWIQETGAHAFKSFIQRFGF